MSTPFHRVALIGLGLQGSSISHALRKTGLAATIVGADNNPESRETALQIGLVSEVYPEPEHAVRDADLVVLCVPVGVCGAIAQRIGPYLSEGAILSDVGSVKGSVVRDVGPHVPAGVHFVPGHPIAGTEFTGPESGFAELYVNRWFVITPVEASSPEAVERIAAMWRAFGSNVEIMTPAHHDLVFAITSHLPHLIAYNIVNTAAHLGRVTDSEVIKFSASGFRDFTRIAASDPTMWRDVFLNNKDAVLEMLGRFTEDLITLQRAIRFGDGDMLHQVFSEARSTRKGIIDAGQDTTAPDFGRHQSPSDPRMNAEKAAPPRRKAGNAG